MFETPQKNTVAEDFTGPGFTGPNFSGAGRAPETREFGYHAQITWAQWILFGYFSLLSLMAMFQAFNFWQLGGSAHPEFIGAAFRALGYAVFTGLLFALYRALATFKLVVDSGGFRYSNFRARGYLHWRDITSIRGRYLPYFGGWLTIKSADTTLRLTVVLRDIDVFTRILHQNLQQFEQPRFEHKNLFGFLKTATYSAMSFHRMKTGWWRLLLALAAGAAINIVMIMLLPQGKFFIEYLMIFLVLGFALPSILFAVCDILNSRAWILEHANEETLDIAPVSPEVHADIWAKDLRGIVGGALALNILVWALISFGLL